MCVCVFMCCVQRTCFARVHNGAVRKAKVVRLKASSAVCIPVLCVIARARYQCFLYIACGRFLPYQRKQHQLFV